MRELTLIGLLAGAAFALAGAAQQRGSSCDLEVETLPGARSTMTTLPDGEARNDVWGGIEATCGSKWLRADSAVFFDRRGVLYLFWNIEYEDEGRTLVAERAIYYQDEDWVRAEGDVVLTDTVGGSTLSGPLLEYYPVNANRPLERIFAPDRPHLVFRHRDSAADDPSFEVDGDRMHIYGDSAIAAQGTVVAVRGELTAYGDSMDLDLGLGELWLLGSPSVEAEETLLEGDSILIFLEESRVQEIQAWPNASAQGSELSLSAPLLRLFLDGEEISRAVASAGAPERTGAVDSAGREPWARSVSQDYVLTADSIDILRPGGRLERVIAVTSARAATADRLVTGRAALEKDWLVGDTITGYFAPADSGGGGEQEARLARLEASGDTAKALYHIYEEREEGEAPTLPGVNNVIGRIITLWLEEGEVKNARCVGPCTGLYLEPTPIATDGDSTAVLPDTALADTSRAIPDTTTTDSSRLRGVG
ncbi:MAG: hypothetical protein PVJ64_11415 [Gemmatimonadales bacterium]|jgi:hypothetical protein